MAAIDYFVNMSLGTGGSGTMGAPWGNLSSVPTGSNIGAGSRIFIAGTGRQQYYEGGDLPDDITIQQWEGQTQAFLRGDKAITSWGAPTGNAYPAVGGAPVAEPTGVTEDWSIRVDSEGRHYAWLAKVADAATCDSTPGSWAWDTGTLYVHPSGSGDPALLDEGISWTFEAGTRHGLIYVESANGLLVAGINLGVIPDSTADYGYGISIEGGTDSNMEDCDAPDSGYHAFGFHGGSGANNWIRRCRAWGGQGALFVHHGGDGAGVGGGCVDCSAWPHGRIATDGETLLDTSASGFLTHGGTGGISDVEWLRCSVKGIAGMSANGFFCTGGAPTVSGDETNYRNYKIRAIDCTLEDTGGNGNIEGQAFVRNRWRLNLGEAGQIGVDIQGSLNALWESCAIDANMDAFTSPARVIDVSAAARCILRGTTIHVHSGGSPTPASRAIIRYAANSYVHARGCVFSFADPAGSFSNGTSVTAGLQDIRDCWYYNIATNGYSPNNSHDAQAEFAANIDTTGVYEVNPGYASAPSDLSPPGGSQLHARRKSLADLAFTLGIGGTPYGGNYGGHQVPIIYSPIVIPPRGKLRFPSGLPV